MASMIDITKPVYGNPTTQSVRDNFEFAHDEITDLQNKTTGAPFLPILGGTMNGPITMQNDPAAPYEVATKRYVDNLAFGSSGGVPDSPGDGFAYARMYVTGGNSWVKQPLFQTLNITHDVLAVDFHIGSDATYNFIKFNETTNDYLRFNRATSNFELVSNNTVVQSWNATGTVVNNPWTVNNSLSVHSATPTIHMNADVAANKYIYFEKLGLKQWALGVDASANGTFGIYNYDASGNIIDNPMLIAPGAGGGIVFSRNPQIQPPTSATWPALLINSLTDVPKNLFFQKAGLSQWAFNVDVAPNAFNIVNYNAAGAILDYPINIGMGTGLVTIARQLKIKPTQNINAQILIDGKQGDDLAITGAKNGLSRWIISLGTSNTESGSNAGSDFYVARFNDAGAYISTPITISRGTGALTYLGDLLVRQGPSGIGKVGVFSAAGGVISLTSPNYGGYMQMENSGNLVFGWTDGNGTPLTSKMWLQQNGTFYNGGGLLSSGWTHNSIANFYIMGTGDQRQYILAPSKMLWCQTSGANDSLYLDNTSGVGAIMIRGYNYNWFQLQTDGNVSMSNFWAAKVGGGSWADSSDIRGKDVVGEYQAGLNEVIQLKPIRYRLKNNLEIIPHFERPRELLEDWKDPPSFRPHEKAGDRIFIGLGAQDCEGFMPEMVIRQNGFIDGKPDDNIRGLDTSPLIYALINSIKELNTRLTAVEGIIT